MTREMVSTFNPPDQSSLLFGLIGSILLPVSLSAIKDLAPQTGLMFQVFFDCFHARHPADFSSCPLRPGLPGTIYKKRTERTAMTAEDVY
jgi:hypothetical protein